MTARPPTTVKPLTTVKPPTTARPRMMAKPRMTAKPRTTVKLPMTAKLPMTVKPPTTVRPPTTAKPPTTVRPPMMAKPPTMVKPPTMAKPPMTARPPMTVKPPTTVKPTITALPTKMMPKDLIPMRKPQRIMGFRMAFRMQAQTNPFRAARTTGLALPKMMFPRRRTITASLIPVPSKAPRLQRTTASPMQMLRPRLRMNPTEFRALIPVLPAAPGRKTA